MSKTTKAKSHLSSKAVIKKIKTTVGFWRVQKWLIVYNAINYPRKSIEIAQHLAVSKSLVNKTISEYNRFGSSSIETKGKGGRRNALISLESERQLMDGFIAQAQKGRIATADEIKVAFEKLVGKTVHKTTIYRLLERSGWRKIVPRPHHPQKDKQAQEDFKKTLVKK